MIFNSETFRRFFLGRRRHHFAWALLLVAVLRAHQLPDVWGSFICFSGAMLRFWSSGYLRKEARLAVGGPYQRTRNPLYLGTLLMGMGATISVGAHGVALAMGIAFFLNYHFVIEREEERLKVFFGEPYLLYCSLVPRFFPQFFLPAKEKLAQVNDDPAAYVFSFALARQNKFYEAFITFAALMFGMAGIVLIKNKIGI